MAHFPRPDPNVRAPRVRAAASNAVSFSFEGKRVPAVLMTLSITGGLAQFPDAKQASDLAELEIRAQSASITGLVELLSPLAGYPAHTRPFRFVALDEEDNERLATLVKHLQEEGNGIL
jgi:hypothetical protein